MAYSANSRPEGRGGLTAWLYRHRGSTAVPFALAAVLGARLRPAAALAGAVLIVLGEALRLWAAAHIGPHSRASSFQAPRLVTTGPYRWMRHPLYAGNAILCVGMLLFSGAYLPWLPLALGVAFILQYGLFIKREERLLAAEWGDAWREYCHRVPCLGVGRRAGPGGDTPGGGALPAGAAPPGASASVPAHAAPTPLTATLRLEWPTLRTILGLLVLIAIRWLLRGR